MSENGQKGNSENKLIITIVKKGVASNVVSATKKAGVGGGTILFGRGTKTSKLYLQILGMDYDPEKEIILTAVGSETADSILELITQTASLNKPGNGIAFMLDIKNLLGVAHLLNVQHT